jgi:hypothetical protein
MKALRVFVVVILLFALIPAVPKNKVFNSMGKTVFQCMVDSRKKLIGSAEP